MADRLSEGRKFRVLNVIDNYTRECVGSVAEFSFPAERVTAYLDQWMRERDQPRALVVDNGTEFTSNVFDAWAYARGIEMNFITPGRPVENALIESFNGKLRDECLNANWFDTREAAREVIKDWKTDYNEERPHTALGNLAPAQYVANLLEWGAQ